MHEPSTAAAVIHLRLLAAPALLRADGGLVALERKDAALLALLALDGPTSRQHAAALLWPDSESQKARNSLRQRLFRLRRAADRDVVDESAALALAAGVMHDLSVRAQLAQDPTAAAGELLGSFGYEDCAELDDWVRAARERFRAQRRDAIAAAAAAEEAGGHIARALVYADRLVVDEPLSEQAHRMVMRLHYRRGDRSAALAAYARCEQWLRRELDAEPSTETRELAQLIERSGELPGSAARRLPTAIARPPVRVGRERQFRALEEAWEQQRVAVVIADAGMGKTRLLGDFAQTRGIPLVGARPGDERVPYALLARLLRSLLGGDTGVAKTVVDPLRAELARVLPEIGSAPSEPLNEARFRQAVAQACAAQAAGGLAGVALDDLHFADSASLELLPALVTSGLRFALAVRGAEMPPALAAWEGVETGTTLIEIALPALSEADVRQLLDTLALAGIDSAAIAGPLTRHTGGNPYFVLETLGAMVVQPDALRGPLPTAPSVGALIERRLAQLSPAALRLARIAALAGPEFSAALAAHVLQAHPLDLAEAWSELERAHVLQGDGFAHDLVRDVALRGVPGPIGRLLHRGIAEYLDAQSAPPARVAQHFAESGAWLLAARCHVRAAEAARRASRRGEEVEQREAATHCFDRAGDADAAFEARAASIEGLILVRGVEHAQTVIEGMIAVARTDAQKAAALTARANAALMAADHVTGIASAREALALAEALGQPALRFEAARLIAVGLAQQGKTTEAEAVLAPFESMIENEGSLQQRGHYWSDLAYVLNSERRLRRTAAALTRAIECARELGDLAELAMLTTNLATVYGNLGHADQAYEHALRARALQVELGGAAGPIAGVIEAHVALYAAARGHYSISLQAFDSALECFRRDGQTLWIAVCSNNLAMTLIELGQYTRARRALEYQSPSVSHVAARGALLSGRIARLLGSSPATDLARAADELALSEDFYIGALLGLERTEMLDAHEALRTCDAIAGDAEQREYGGIALKARLLAVRSTLHGGDVGAAAARWAALQPSLASQQAADCSPVFAAAVGFEVLRAAGEHERAAAALAPAVAWLRQAASQVPEAFRDSFLDRNPVHRGVLTAATRL
ncbi:MAG TPA: BTAD domain-containing putative transcriptional regulator [Burkholderiaceae bacterium]|nr:BTAD domain-containing putative transcriptional regulator [Burkholderiaceae bacterium]